MLTSSSQRNSLGLTPPFTTGLEALRSSSLWKGVLFWVLLTLCPKIASSAGLIREWGTPGTGPGQFQNPYGIVIDENQIVYVTDEANNRIQTFDSTGVFLGQWGSFGSEPGQLFNPTGIDIGADGLVYVSDHQNHRIEAFTVAGVFVRTFTASGMFHPVGLDCETSGNLWVAAAGGNVYRFSSIGTVLQVITTGGTPYGVTADGNTLYVSLCAGNRVDKYTLSPFGVEPFANSGFFCPEGSLLDSDGNFWVCDTGHDRVLKYDPSGTLLGTLQLSTNPRAIPSDIAFDINGDLYITEWGLHKIAKYSVAGFGPPCVDVAAMDLDPNTINTAAGGNYIAAHLEFPTGYDPAEVQLDSVRLNGTVAAAPNFFEITDWNHNHVPDLALKFPRDAVEATLGEGNQVPITIKGTIGASCFTGTTLVRVIRPKLTHPNGGESYLTGVRALVEWENPQGWTVNYAQIYYSADGGDTWSQVADHVIGTSYVWEAPATPTENARLRVLLVDDAGVMGYDSSDGPFAVQTSSGIGDGIPTSNRLYQNSPNPFQSTTRIQFDVPEPTRVTLKVFDLPGREVKTLADGWFPVGSHEVSWDARDAAGHTVAGGIYFIQLQAGTFSDTKRMYLKQ